MTTTTTLEQVADTVSRSATDPAFRNELLQAPAATLQSVGIAIPDGVALKVVENSRTTAHLIVPAMPSEMSAEAQQELTALAESTAAPTSALDAWAKVVIDAWNDADLKTRLLSDPATVLAERGITLPAGLSLRTLEATDSEVWMTLPPPATSDINIGDVAESITDSFDALTKLITAGSYVAGFAFMITAIMKFKAHKDNPTQIPIGTPIALVFIAAALVLLPLILDHAGTNT
jgi:hypothetical protein